MRYVVSPVLAALMSLSGAAFAADVPSAVISKCETCHGVTGDSTAKNIPRLNGQHAEYIITRFNSFLSPGSEDPHATASMWSIARTMSDVAVRQVATYYSQQTPMAPLSAPGSPLAATGAKLYASGNPGERIAACQSCHGPGALGQGATPRLAGQHGLYLKNQLERLRLNLRANETMHPITNSMSDQEIAALVAYLGSD